jgi:MFS family permease
VSELSTAQPPAAERRLGLSRSTFLLAATSLFADISTEMLYPILPIFLTQTLKANGSIVGLVDGLAQAAQNVMQGVSGSVSDRVRRRKPLALVGYLLSALSKPIMGVAPSWPALLGARLLDRIGAGSRSAPRDALITASVHQADRGRAFGLEGLGDNAGAFLGPLIALLLINVARVDLRTVFYLAVIPGLLAFLLMVAVKEERAADARSSIGLTQGRFPRRYWRYLGVTALFTLGNSSNAFLILRTRDVGVALDRTILIYAAFNPVAALVSYPAGALSDRIGRRNVLLAAFAIFLLSYLGFAIAENALLIAGLFACYGLFQGMFRAVGKALAADCVPEPLRASGIGWYSATVGVVQLLASLVAGQLWDRVGHAATFYYGAAFAFCGLIALPLVGIGGQGPVRR